MEHHVYENKLSRLSARFNLMVFIAFFLLVSNALLAGLCWYTSIHQKIEVTPFSGSNGYLKSESEVDGHYLNLMSENFIYSRFNVTPETVDANYNRLLGFVDSSNYALNSSEVTVRRYKQLSAANPTQEYELLAMNENWASIRVLKTSGHRIVGAVSALIRTL